MNKVFMMSIVLVSFAHAQNIESFQSASKKVRSDKVMELKTLEIKAKIHEPTLVYILDNEKVHVDFDFSFSQLSKRLGDVFYTNDWDLK